MEAPCSKLSQKTQTSFDEALVQTLISGSSVMLLLPAAGGQQRASHHNND